jgi:hypothetical protein
LQELLSKWQYAQIKISLFDEDENETDIPDVTYPGNDPKEAPEGTEWKGKGEKGSKEGNYYNKDTGESWHPDLDHPDPIGPHWDYNFKGSGRMAGVYFPMEISSQKRLLRG